MTNVEFFKKLRDKGLTDQQIADKAEAKGLTTKAGKPYNAKSIYQTLYKSKSTPVTGRKSSSPITIAVPESTGFLIRGDAKFLAEFMKECA